MGLKPEQGDSSYPYVYLIHYDFVVATAILQ